MRIALPVLHILGVCICPSLPHSHFTGEPNMKRDLCFWRAAPASPRTPWLWSTVLPTAGSRDVTGRGADEPWGTMPRSCADVPTRVQGWKRPISSPCPWLSGQWKISPCTVLFCALSSPNCLNLLNFCPSHMSLYCRKQGQDCTSWPFL